LPNAVTRRPPGFRRRLRQHKKTALANPQRCLFAAFGSSELQCKQPANDEAWVSLDLTARHPGYRCDPLEDGFLIVPLGTPDCPEVETLALLPPRNLRHRTARTACLCDEVELLLLAPPTPALRLGDDLNPPVHRPSD